MVAFITLTNTGYVEYTLNLLKSLENIKSSVLPTCYCIGNEGHSKLISKGYQSTLINEEKNSGFQSWRKHNWADIVSNKFDIIYQNLLTRQYVLITDGDIVYEDNKFLDYLKENIADNDMLIQNDTMDDNNDTNLCSGFMFIKSSKLTLDLFNPKCIEEKRTTEGWGDQHYLNQVKSLIKYKKLPLDLFPNGQYYYKNAETIKPFIIHFNWVVGHQKRAKMLHHKKWYL